MSLGLPDQAAKMLKKILDYPIFVCMTFFLLCCLAGWQLRHFSFDASSDTLVVQGDPKLAFYHQMEQIFGGDDFLILTVKPLNSRLFSREAFDLVDGIQIELGKILGVESVFSYLDAPLLRSPPVPLEKLDTDYLTLRSETVDLMLAREEMLTSPFLVNYLVSEDGSTTAIRIDLKIDESLVRLSKERDELNIKNRLELAEQDRLKQINLQYASLRAAYLHDRQSVIDEVRQLKKRYQSKALLYLGGVPMIAADMIAFIKNDVLVFGLVVLALMSLVLYSFFRHFLWVFLPLAMSATGVLLTSGLLGFLSKPVTVISSNFILLLVVITIALTIHLIVRYRELYLSDGSISHKVLVLNTMKSKFAPSLYTALTTMVAFSSMMTSRILPVEDFGWIMCMGIVISFSVTYMLFPALLILAGPHKSESLFNDPQRLIDLLSDLARNSSGAVLSVTLILSVVTAIGLSQLSFNNRFVDYFTKKTEIRQGMEYIDENLGGTVPLEVYLRYESWQASEEEDDFFDEGDDTYPQRYWFTPEKIADVGKMHEYLESKSPTGKVLSIATLEKIARQFNDGEPLDATQLSAVLGLIPPESKEQLIDSYANPESGYMKISARVRESGPFFSRSELASDIVEYADKHIKGIKVDVNGMMVLFDDTLSQMFSSQINTLLYVVLAIFSMFSLLLRSLLLAVLALLPNLVAAATVIAVMGFAKVPLDMMTITIAAIVIGIGVDDAIHYLHRFRQELDASGSLDQAVKQAHSTIGKAMYFTTVVVVGGFFVLGLSNFLPTVYFGLLTALAMILALTANLVILPSLLVKVYGSNKDVQGTESI